MKSMTGYGKGIAETDERKVTVELRTVNHRFLDVTSKLPRILVCCEDVVKKTIATYLTRGHVDVFVNYEDKRQGKSEIKPDLLLAKRYLEIGKELEGIGLTNDLTVCSVMKMPEVLTLKSEDDDENEVIALAKAATQAACEKLVEMREAEGAILKTDMLTKLDEIERLTKEVEERAPQVSVEHGEKLRQRIEESLNGIAIDESKLLNEVCFYVDRINIDEEITRLKGHIAHGRAIFEEKGAVGKKLDFLVQEMNREVNTTGSKSNDLYITERVLLLKNEVEKLREQVQNIE
ncbi:MAG: YicC family protein [Clostridiales bacterium]|jgi:uncharacterized protein (TIGR00255 family)|nr:YicC family protein [Clostridiales bacterium]MDY4655120.1 YicC/YloC family endoribonuclease [Eubacteriales bacterium]